jgi:hypothetical protein
MQVCEIYNDEDEKNLKRQYNWLLIDLRVTLEEIECGHFSGEYLHRKKQHCRDSKIAMQYLLRKIRNYTASEVLNGFKLDD